MRIAAWNVSAQSPTRLDRASVDLEEHLEDWIADAPDLLDHGLSIVARQSYLDRTLRSDLIGRSASGAWVVIEIKAGALHRDTVSQALDYAAQLREMPASDLEDVLDRSKLPGTEPPEVDDAPREVEVILAGVGEHVSMERVSEYLRSYDLPIRAVSFEVLDIEGSKVLVREELDREIGASTKRAASKWQTVDEILEQLSSADDRAAARTVLDAAERNGLILRSYAESIMVAPPQNRTRYLMNIWVKPGVPELTASPEAFVEFFNVDSAAADALLGAFRPEGKLTGAALTPELAARIASGLDDLLRVDV